jgi:dephospho-CoA kinase
MIVVGVTGSIAMGKSTVAGMFAALGAPAFDADAAVSEFYASRGVKTIEAAFPGVTVDGRIDRELLAKRVLGYPTALKELESLVHPAVADARALFLKQAAVDGRRFAIVDVPLLFETGGEASVDLVVVASATEALQRARALARKGMTEANLAAILSRQTSDAEKRRRAHFVVDTRGSLEQTRAQAQQFMRAAAGLDGGGRGRHA